MIAQRSSFLRALVVLLAALGLSLSTAACNTIGGAGKDVEAAGEAVQDASKTVSDKLSGDD